MSVMRIIAPAAAAGLDAGAREHCRLPLGQGYLAGQRRDVPHNEYRGTIVELEVA